MTTTTLTRPFAVDGNIVNIIAQHLLHAGLEGGGPDEENGSEAQRLASRESRAERPASHESSATTRPLYLPTDYKEKQKLLAKQRKEQGATATTTTNKKRKPHEQHYDDCGETFDGLGKYLFFAGD